MAMSLPRVLLADDHVLVTEALRKLLEPQFNIVGAVADGMALVQTAPLFEPDVVVVDIAMPLLNGLEAGRQIKTMMPAVKLVFLTMNEDPELAREAMQRRASGYLLKSSAASELFQAIQIALKGGSYVTPRLKKNMEDAFIRCPQPKSYGNKLTPRQREVIQVLAEGKSMKEAAAILKLTPRTIAFHKYRVMERLGVKSSASLIQFAMSNHILIG
jgi:DNA-binding NarL/FixJ family response regulator